MPQANNNIQQTQPKRSGIVVIPDEINDIKFWDITLITDENVSLTLADWQTKTGKHPFRLNNSNKSVTFKIKQGDENVFVEKNMFRAIEAAMKYNGFDMNAEMFLNAIRNNMGHDRPTKEDMAFLDTSMDSIFNTMFDHFEGKLNDPVVQQLLNQMHLFDPSTGEFKSASELQKKTIKSAENAMRACAQWRSNGRSGVPTYVATKRQWMDNFNRYVINNATRMVLSTPNDNVKQAMSDTMNQYNITRDELRGNAHTYQAADTYYKNHNSTDNALGGFHGEIFYDISDTEVMPGMEDLFNEHAGLESNLWPDRWNKKAIEGGNISQTTDDEKKAVEAAGFKSDEQGEEKIINGLKIWCDNNQGLSGNVKRQLDANNLVGAVRSYFELDQYIDRERNEKIKNALLNMCVFSVLNYYGVAPSEMLRAYQLSRDYLMKNKKVSTKAKISIMPFFANFVNMINNNNKQTQAANESKAVFDGFKNLWNRMVNTEEKNRNVKLW